MVETFMRTVMRSENSQRAVLSGGPAPDSPVVKRQEGVAGPFSNQACFEALMLGGRDLWPDPRSMWSVEVRCPQLFALPTSWSSPVGPVDAHVCPLPGVAISILSPICIS